MTAVSNASPVSAVSAVSSPGAVSRNAPAGGAASQAANADGSCGGGSDAFAALLDGLTAAAAADIAPADGKAIADAAATQAAPATAPDPNAVLAQPLQASAQGVPVPVAQLMQQMPAGAMLAGHDVRGKTTGEPAAAATPTVSLAGAKTPSAKADFGTAALPATAAAPAASDKSFGDIARQLQGDLKAIDLQRDSAPDASGHKPLPEALPLTAAAPALPAEQPLRTDGAGTVHRAALNSQPQDAAFAGDLTAEVRYLVDSGLQQAELRMNPAELGPIHIQLSITGQTADVSFAAAHSATRDGISQSLPALRDMLAAQGMSLGQAGVDSGQQQAFQQAAQQAREANGSNGTGSGHGISAAATPTTVTVRATRGMLDMYA